MKAEPAIQFCLSFIGLELPQINYQKYRGMKYHYAYGIGDFNFIDGEKVYFLYM